MATAKTGTISSPDRKIRAMPTPRPQAATIGTGQVQRHEDDLERGPGAEEARIEDVRAEQLEEGLERHPRPVLQLATDPCRLSTGDCWYPPRAVISRGANCPATPAAAAAPARLSSYHRAARPLAAA